MVDCCVLVILSTTDLMMTLHYTSHMTQTDYSTSAFTLLWYWYIDPVLLFILHLRYMLFHSKFHLRNK